MKKVLVILGSLTMLLALAGPKSIAAGTENSAQIRDSAQSALGFMRSVYQAQYAPKAWKNKYAGWDLDTAYNAGVQNISSKDSITQKEARRVLMDFVYSMRDYHTSMAFNATEKSTLPFSVKAADGRYFIMYIDRSKLPVDSFPFTIGDELISFNGKAIADEVQMLMSNTIQNVETTDRQLAALAITLRRASRGYDVPQGPVTLGIQRKGETVVTKIQLAWEYTPEIATPVQNDSFDLTQKFHLDRKMSVETGFEADRKAGNPYLTGNRESFMPALGEKIWENSPEGEFDAYIFQNTDGKLVGYIRIPSYVPSDADKAVAEFANIISRFEISTSSMVIDQVNNPGGSVFYLYALASMLATQPLLTPLHEMTINQADVLEAYGLLQALAPIKDDATAKAMLGATLEGFPVSYQTVLFIRGYLNFEIQQWQQGKTLTSPFWIWGADNLNPGVIHYSKPILVLINELDFSGGDFFPTILQDNKRATIMGTRTAGAGGYVLDQQFPNLLGVAYFRVTASIAHRVDQNPIENLGVTPDVPYSLTAKDLQTNYSDYTAAVLKTLSDLSK